MSDHDTTEKKTAPALAPSFLRDQSGTAMLEFILVAPMLCYLTIGILFMRHQLDYAQDSVVRFNHLTFKHILPNEARSVSGDASDEGGFGSPLEVRMAVQLGGLTGLAGGGSGMGMMLAMERFFGMGMGTPYDQWELKRENYLTQYEAIAQMPQNPWKKTLGAMGTYFGNKVGGGTVVAPGGLEVGWKERFPLIADPWQRHFSSKLDPKHYLLVGMVLDMLNIFTWGRSPVPRFDNRDTDIGEDEFVSGGGSCDELSLEEESGKSTVWNIIK